MCYEQYFKKFNKGIQLLIIVIIVLQACVYEPKDIYEIPVNENPTPPELQIVNLNEYQDSIFIYFDEIKFNYTISKNDIKSVSFFIDEVEYTNINIENNSFSLNYNVPPDGIHNLTVEIYTATGSGSIADQLGAEVFIFSKTWKLIVKRNYSSKLQESVQNGFLKINWTPYRLNDFKEFVIHKSYRWSETVELERIKSTNFIDSSFIGEECEYYVELITTDGKSHNWGYLELNNSLPKVYIITSSDNKLTIIWNKSKYYNSIGTYKVEHSFGNDYIQDFSTQNPNDTSFIFTNGLFGDQFNLKLQVLPKKSYIPLTPDILYRFETYKEITLGHQYASNGYHTSYLSQIDAENFVYVNGCDSLIKYSTISLTTVGKLGYSTPGISGCNFARLVFSPSGKYITNYKVGTNDLMFINCGNMANYSIYNLTNLTGSNYNPEIPVSENSIALVNSVASNFMYNGFYLYDLNTNTSIKRYESYGGIGEKISSNGDYIFLTDDSLRLVKYENATFVNVWTTSKYNNPKLYQFNPINNDQLVTWDGTTFSIRKCEDFSLINDFALTDGSILNIDFFKNEILTQIKGHLLVRSMLNGNLLHDIPINFDASSWYYACILVNHTIVSPMGIMCFIN